MCLQRFGASFDLSPCLEMGSNAKSVNVRIVFGGSCVAYCLQIIVGVSFRLFALCGFLFRGLSRCNVNSWNTRAITKTGKQYTQRLKCEHFQMLRGLVGVAQEVLNLRRCFANCCWLVNHSWKPSGEPLDCWTLTWWPNLKDMIGAKSSRIYRWLQRLWLGRKRQGQTASFSLATKTISTASWVDYATLWNLQGALPRGMDLSLVVHDMTCRAALGLRSTCQTLRLSANHTLRASDHDLALKNCSPNWPTRKKTTYDRTVRYWTERCWTVIEEAAQLLHRLDPLVTMRFQLQARCQETCAKTPKGWNTMQTVESFLNAWTYVATKMANHKIITGGDPRRIWSVQKTTQNKTASRNKSPPCWMFLLIHEFELAIEDVNSACLQFRNDVHIMFVKSIHQA